MKVLFYFILSICAAVPGIGVAGCLEKNLAQFIPFDQNPATPVEKYISSLKSTVACLDVQAKDFYYVPSSYTEIQTIRSFILSLAEAQKYFPEIHCKEISNRHGDWFTCEAPTWVCGETGLFSSGTQCRSTLAY